MSQVVSLVAARSEAVTPTRSSPGGDVVDNRGEAMELADSSSPRTIGSLATKRAASSTSIGDPDHHQLKHLRIDTMSAESPRDHICLCVPVPKIPRPRNAFILFRQHHQAKVVADNPNISNPEISKIIGEQWTEAPDHVKERWKALADEEKQRHQLQYPNYRYQPRRNTRSQANRPATAGSEDGARCPNCNGRTPAVKTTAQLHSAVPASARPAVTPYTPSARGSEAEALARRGSYSGLTPRGAQFSPQGPPGYYQVDEYETEPQETKRRRVDSVSYHAGPSTGLPSGHMSRAHNLTGPSSASRLYDPPPMAGPGGLSRSRGAPMAPPPRPPATPSWAEHSPQVNRLHSFDESLVLPPLQTSGHRPLSRAGADQYVGTPFPGSGTPGGGQPHGSNDVMSIPFTKKLAVLSRICHEDPMFAPAKIEPGNRRSVIAVEGPKAKILAQVGKAIEKAMLTIEHFDVKSWGNHSAKEIARREDVPDDDQEAVWDEARRLIKAYFKTMERWHDISEEIEEHVASKHKADAASRRGSGESASSTHSHKSTTATTTANARTPVALLREGYSLTLSDTFACSAPITDQYKAIDHWQWAATLWRRVIEADLVVYVKPSEEDEIGKYGAVHIQRQPALMVVRIPVGGDLDEATERRVAFEVVEWVRGG